MDDSIPSPLRWVSDWGCGLPHGEYSRNLQFSKCNNHEGIISNEIPNSYIHFQCHQTKTSGESQYSSVAVNGPAGTDEWLNLARNNAKRNFMTNKCPNLVLRVHVFIYWLQFGRISCSFFSSSCIAFDACVCLLRVSPDAQTTALE